LILLNFKGDLLVIIIKNNQKVKLDFLVKICSKTLSSGKMTIKKEP
jgi:hypothetical protein